MGHLMMSLKMVASRGRIVAIDIETGEFEVADDPLAASDQLFARCPDTQP